jgi:hypothetical protein
MSLTAGATGWVSFSRKNVIGVIGRVHSLDGFRSDDCGC